jgi:hypothetical protein
VGADGELVTENQEIGRELLQAFFPAPPPCEQEEAPAVYNQLPWEPIAKHEVRAAVFRASQDKALGRDGPHSESMEGVMARRRGRNYVALYKITLYRKGTE